MTLIGRFLTNTYVVTRSTKGTYVKGRYLPGPTEELLVKGSLQPTSGRDLKLPEEGSRLRQYFKFFSDQRITTINASTLADADVITINGDRFRAMTVSQWEGTDLDHFKTIVWREPQQESDK